MIIGELELDYGSKALEEKRYDDAFKHFITGTKLSSAGSMFNLALCYELGLGTATDFVKVTFIFKYSIHLYMYIYIL
jgi:TPR repeat protein